MSQNTSHAVMAQRHDSLVTLKEARAQGCVRYFTGKPCKRGHISERLVSSRECLACARESVTRAATGAAYYRANAARIKTRVRTRWRDNPEAKAKDKISRDKKRDDIRAYDRMRAKRDREKKRVIIDRWIKANPERHRALAVAKSHRRRARILAAEGSHTADDVARIMAGQKGRCWWCQKKVGRSYHVDHRIALARGGSNGPENLVIACPDCNRRKNAQSSQEFAGRLL